MEFEAKEEGEAMLLFESNSARDENIRTLSVHVHVQAANFRLESGKLHVSVLLHCNT